MNRVIAYLLLPGVLAGCAAGNVKQIQTEPANALHVQIDQNYQRLYKNLLRKMDECAGEGQVGLFAQLHIKQTILSDLKEASISYMMTNLGTQSYYLHVDIHGIGEDRSKLDAYVAYSTWKDWLPRVERWARQPDATCADTPAPEQP